MPELLKTVDAWFLMLSFVLLGGGLLWAVKRMFDDLIGSIKELKDLIKDLFEHRNDHETRITAVEVRCKLLHGDEACKR